MRSSAFCSIVPKTQTFLSKPKLFPRRERSSETSLVRLATADGPVVVRKRVALQRDPYEWLHHYLRLRAVFTHLQRDLEQ
jgi:hypothetical protein